MTSKARDRTAFSTQRHLDRTFHRLCHDIRQPAAAILALVAAAESEADLDPGVRERLRQIAEEARHISTIAGQAAGESMTFRPLDAADLAARVVESMRASTGAAISLAAEPNALVVGDAPSLRRALINLIENAVRAAGPGGAVRFTVAARDGQVQFEVDDSGPGFGSGPVGVGGYGLGVVEWLAATHGGDLEILRGRLGGTLARLSLPAARTEVSKASEGR